jgi:SanA protein
MKVWRMVWRMGMLACILFALLMIAGNWWVVQSTSDNIYSDYESLPINPVGLVLGTSSRLSNGSPNPFFNDRMNAAARLYAMGKVGHIIVSGDNRTKFYNEPMEMKKALIKLGVPDSAITLDYAGLRTLDSIVRSKEIFGQNNITIITQPFHSYRALFISQYYHINAVALIALEPADEPGGSIYMREYFARAKAILDLYVLKTGPRYLGEKEPIRI